MTQAEEERIEVLRKEIRQTGETSVELYLRIFFFTSVALMAIWIVVAAIHGAIVSPLLVFLLAGAVASLVRAKRLRRQYLHLRKELAMFPPRVRLAVLSGLMDADERGTREVAGRLLRDLGWNRPELSPAHTPAGRGSEVSGGGEKDAEAERLGE